MKKIIVNADDFALHTLVNKVVIQGHLYGCVTSASLMPIGTDFEEAVKQGLKHQFENAG